MSLPDPGCFWGVWDDRSVHACPATHPMDIMDPQKNDNDDFHQKAAFGEFGMIEVSMHVQLHIQWTLWIHKRMIMMTFNKNSHLDPRRSNT